MTEHMFEAPRDSVDLRQLLLQHQKHLLESLASAKVFSHPTAKGDVGEGAWHELFTTFLPRRYQVSNAFVLDARGGCSQQIDLVVHDRHFCPLLFEKSGQRYIPAESVFAVFEVKPSLGRDEVLYAQEKATSVRGLHRTGRPLVDRGVARPPREPFQIVAGVLATESTWSPPCGGALERALATDDPNQQLDIGCAPAHGAFEAFYDDGVRLDISDVEAGLMFFLLRLFHRLQEIGSPMAIDLRAYSQPLETATIGASS
jgi:hypothetical protein